MMRVIHLLLATLLYTTCAHAELTIEITKGVDNPAVISIVPFHFSGATALNENVSDIVASDLVRSGQFKATDPAQMLSLPSVPEDVIFRDWRLLGSEYVLIGQIVVQEKSYHLRFSLFDVAGQRPLLLNKSLSVPGNGLREMAHYVSDVVYEAITGIKGAFSTEVIYVEQQGGQYRLIRADMDGARPQLLLDSPEPILSPAWSPDGQHVAYVSFETGKPVIFKQHILSGQREKLTDFKGLNGAPAWSPDGQSLAVVLSKDGNPEIYILRLASRQLTRLTTHFAIDTEPTWSIDGRHIFFTSNRGGTPQIYKVSSQGGQPKRLTFDGGHNAKAQLTPDGRRMIFVHRRDGIFHIAAQNLSTGELRVLTTKANLDESPSIAPNGVSLIYATKSGGRGVLASIAIDAGAQFILPSTSGNVREPAWSPFLR